MSPGRVAAAAVSCMFLFAACQSAPTATQSVVPATGTARTVAPAPPTTPTLTLTATASVLATPVPTVMATAGPKQSPTYSPATATAVAGSAVQTTGRIYFNRQDTATDTSTSFTINPDGSAKQQIGPGNVSCSGFTPDGTTLGCTSWFEYGGRPATAYADGTGLAVLDAEPGRIRSLECGLFDVTRFICGAYPVDFHDDVVERGLYVLSGFDGTDITRLTTTPDGCNDTDVVPSPDAKSLLFTRVCIPDDHGTLLRIGIDGKGLRPLSPQTVSVVAPDSFGRLAADWSPDGSSITYAAFVPEADSTALYVVKANGSDTRQIVPPDIGAVSAQWSPRRDAIVFTSRLRSDPQVWTVAPDGTNPVRLTEGSDGSTSVAPVWSPDGSSLLFARLTSTTTTLWTMVADGTSQKQIADLGNPESIGADWGAPATGDGAMPLAQGGTIFPGTYWTAFEPGLTLTIGHVVDLDCVPGYRCRGDIDLNLEKWVGFEFGNDHGSELNVIRLDRVIDIAAPGKLAQPPDDMAAWITALPGVTTVEPAAPVVVGGITGTAISVKATMDTEFAPTGMTGADDPQWFGLAANHATRLIFLRVNDQTVMITEQVGVDNVTGDFDAAVRGLQPVLDSIRWD